MEVHLINSSPYDANAYLVVAKRPVLIDAGMNASYVLDRVSRFIEVTDVETIILTHAHYDHWGAVEEIKRETGADIALHRQDVVLLSHDVSSVAAMFGANAAAFIPDRILDEGDSIEMGDSTRLIILHTPGHTPGSICLYHPESRSLFSGDTVFPGGSFGRTDLTGGDQQLLVDSLERLAGLDVDILYPGHGEVTERDVTGQIRMSLHLARTYL